VKRFAIALLIAACAATAGAADIHGAWLATSDSPERLHLQMMRGNWNNWGQSFDLSTLGLSPAVVNATTSTPVNLTLTRDAGTFVFEGSFKNGDGAGQFTFTPNRAYLASLRAIGMPWDFSDDKPESDQALSLAMTDLSLAYARTMHQLYPDASVRDIRRARGADVTPEYIASMRAVGMEVTDLHDAARLAGSGVTPDYIRSLRAAGVDVSTAHDARRLRDAGVTPKMIAELADAGYKNLSARDLVRLANAGVDGQYIREMSKYKNKDKQ